MERSDGEKLQVAFYELGLQPFLVGLTNSSVSEKKETLMAFRAGLWGLQVWVSGETIVILDERGFVCSLTNPTIAFALCRFESTQGPGALRAVLKRNVISPVNVVDMLRARYNPTQKVPSAVSKPSPISPKRRKLSSAEFSKILSEI
jgi:hypothetical protein